MSASDFSAASSDCGKMTARHSSVLFALLLRRAQATLNRWIAQSSAAQDELRGLAGRSMILEIDKTSWRVRLSVEQHQALLRNAEADAVADIVVRGGLFDLLAMMRAQSQAQLRAGEIEFRGSLRVAESFSRMLRLARPRLEDELARAIGGVPANVLTQTGAAAFAWGVKTAGAIELDTAEFLQAETRELPRPQEVAEFMLAVERLRDDTDRLRQRVERLAHTASALQRSMEQYVEPQ
jgi:ubiquinone biosynthesis protein UbiJ